MWPGCESQDLVPHHQHSRSHGICEPCLLAPVGLEAAQLSSRDKQERAVTRIQLGPIPAICSPSASKETPVPFGQESLQF